MNNLFKSFVILLVIVLLDQVTKAMIQSSFILGETRSIIPHFFNLTYVKNTGAAFGMLADGPLLVRQVLFLFLPVVACFYLAYLLIKERKKAGLLFWSYLLILSGAIGNLIDRFSMGYVVDFLDFYWKDYHFASFNVADSAISIAAFLLILDAFLGMKKSARSS